AVLLTRGHLLHAPDGVAVDLGVGGALQTVGLDPGGEPKMFALERSVADHLRGARAREHDLAFAALTTHRLPPGMGDRGVHLDAHAAVGRHRELPRVAALLESGIREQVLARARSLRG